MASCPCCSNLLLRHIRQGGVYWLCRSCHAEMPNFEELFDRTPTEVKRPLVFAAQPILIQQVKSYQKSSSQKLAA